mmetsp:Transcript_30372/g.86946  ORF Transcript_30372/g.86946 Transcript_30372/m.86946 type:complete len:422 (-) Transcript_30372:108-1373(-)
MRGCLPPIHCAREFSEEEVLLATQRFDEAYRLGSGAGPAPGTAVPAWKACTGGVPPVAAPEGPGGFFSGVLEDGRRVAVKVLEGTGASESDIVAFQEQAEDLGRLRHPHLATVLGWATFWDRRYWVFDCVDGLDLRQLLRGCRLPNGLVFDWALRLRAVRDVASGLAHLHAEVPGEHQPLVFNSVLIDRTGCAKVVNFSRPVSAAAAEEASGPNAVTVASERRQADGGPEAPASSPEVHQERVAARAFGFVILCLLIGEEAASHRTFSTMPLNPTVLDFVLKSLDGDAIWPLAIGKALAELALSCLQLEEALRPSLGDIAEQLRRMCEQFGLPAAAPVLPPVTDFACGCSPRGSKKAAAAKTTTKSEESSWWSLKCCGRNNSVPGQSLPMAPPPSKAGQGYGHFWGSGEPDELELENKMSL